MYEKKQNLIDLRDGDEVKDIFVVKFKKPVQKYSQGYWFELRIGDKSREVMLKYWGSENEEEVRSLYDSISKDAVIYVEGRVRKYRGDVVINAYSIKPLTEQDYDPDTFIGKSPIPYEELLKELEDLISKIGDSKLRSFLQKLLLSDSEIGRKYREWPAALYKHHNYKHGLLEHSINVAKISLHIANIHNLDKDLVIAGSLLHDIGKIHEFEITTNIRHSLLGQLVGHITIGAELVSKEMEQSNLDENTKLKLLHIIISHHGALEYGSPKTPMFPEALAVYASDLADSQIFQMRSRKEAAITEDDFLYTKDFGNIYLR